MTARPLILLSNDDGVHAEGLTRLAAALRELGAVVVVAPEQEQSATSHRLTLSQPLRHREMVADVHAVDGTPADCIYVALNREGLLPRRPDVVVSGINHGLNLGMDVTRSLPGAMSLQGSVQRIDEYTEGRDGGPILDPIGYWIAGVTFTKDF